MRQSEKEQRIEIAGRTQLHSDKREAELLFDRGADMEAADDWAGGASRKRNKSVGRQ